MKQVTAAWACTVFLGCGSTDISGHVDTDTSTDTPVDVAVDTAPDPAGDVIADPSTDPDLVCPPAGDGVWLQWTLDDMVWGEEMDIDTPCVVEAVGAEDVGRVIIDLSCGTGGLMTPHQIEISSNPHYWLEPWEGQEVVLRYVSQQSFESVFRWLALQDLEGNLLLAAVSAPGLDPPDGDAGEWYAPLVVEMVTGVCPVEPDVCGLTERQGIRLQLGEDAGVVFDSGAGDVGDPPSVSAILATAYHLHTMECFDYPGDWIETLVVVLPGE